MYAQKEMREYVKCKDASCIKSEKIILMSDGSYIFQESTDSGSKQKLIGKWNTISDSSILLINYNNNQITYYSKSTLETEFLISSSDLQSWDMIETKLTELVQTDEFYLMEKNNQSLDLNTKRRILKSLIGSMLPKVIDGELVDIYVEREIMSSKRKH